MWKNANITVVQRFSTFNLSFNPWQISKVKFTPQISLLQMPIVIGKSVNFLLTKVTPKARLPRLRTPAIVDTSLKTGILRLNKVTKTLKSVRRRITCFYSWFHQFPTQFILVLEKKVADGIMEFSKNQPQKFVMQHLVILYERNRILCLTRLSFHIFAWYWWSMELDKC